MRKKEGKKLWTGLVSKCWRGKRCHICSRLWLCYEIQSVIKLCSEYVCMNMEIKGNSRQSWILQTFCSHSLWFSTAVRTTSNQPNYLHCFAHFKLWLYCDMQDWYQVWNVARFVKLLYSKQCWFGSERYDKWLRSVLFSQIIAITLNGRVEPLFNQQIIITFAKIFRL